MEESPKFRRKVYPTGDQEVENERIEGTEGTDVQTDGLINKTIRTLRKRDVPVQDVLGFANRNEDASRLEELRTAIGQRLSQEAEYLITEFTETEFTEEQRTLLATLKSRFLSQSKLHSGIQWTEVASSLRGNTEAFAALKYMEETGGEPDILRIEGGDFVFTDTSTESPSGRRNKTHPEAVGELKHGLELTSEDDYMYLQGLKPVDSNSWSWLGKPSASRDPLAAGDALVGYRVGDDVIVNPHDADLHFERRGFRCSLRVKKA